MLDTSGQAAWPVFSETLPYVDLVLYDIKHIDDGKHRTHTGVSNALVLENLTKVGGSGVPVEIRMPIVPGMNDAEGELLRAARFLAGVKGIERVQLLPYHKLGQAKYRRLGRAYKLPDQEPPGSDHMEEIAGWIRSVGLHVQVGE